MNIEEGRIKLVDADGREVLGYWCDAGGGDYGLSINVEDAKAIENFTSEIARLTAENAEMRAALDRMRSSCLCKPRCDVDEWADETVDKEPQG